MIINVTHIHRHSPGEHHAGRIHSLQRQFRPDSPANPQTLHSIPQIRQIFSQRLHLLRSLHRLHLRGHVRRQILRTYCLQLPLKNKKTLHLHNRPRKSINRKYVQLHGIRLSFTKQYGSLQHSRTGRQRR